MKKLISIVIFVLLTTLIMPSTGCTSRAIAVEAAQSLITMSKGSVENIDTDITRIDQQLYDTQVDLSKLEQVLSPALKWVDYQKKVSKPGRWDIKVIQSGLDQLQNDLYQVTALEVLITRDSTMVTESSYTIKILDFRTKQIDDGDTLHNNLTDLQTRLEQNRQAMVDARDLSVSTTNNALKYANDWKIRKVSGTTYSVSGPGLGWSEQLTIGAWKYDTDQGTLVPDDEPADNLNTVILGKLTP
jgi:cob(I)alamin adenosyltransferase